MAAKTPGKSKAKAKVATAKVPRQKPAQDRRDIFIRQYLIHKNASRAYRESGYEDGPSVHQNASRLLTSDYVQRRLADAKAETLAKLDVKAEDVLRRLVNIAFADAAEITAYEVGACRYCHGVDHHYHWRTQRELDDETSAAIKESDRSGKPVKWPDPIGGTGYTTKSPPHPDCPECDGAGIPRLRFKDTRLLTPAERALFAGVEQTQNGLRYRFNDQMAAIKHIAEHVQFFKARDEANANAFARAIAEISTRGSKMPLRKDEPKENSTNE